MERRLAVGRSNKKIDKRCAHTNKSARTQNKNAGIFARTQIKMQTNIIKMHAHCQYDTTGYKIYFPMYPPSLAMHSLNLFGMPATAFWQMLRSISPHIFSRAALNSSISSYFCRRSRLSTIAQIFSIQLRSGELAGQSSRYRPGISCFNSSNVGLAVCHLAPSC